MALRKEFLIYGIGRAREWNRGISGHRTAEQEVWCTALRGQAEGRGIRDGSEKQVRQSREIPGKTSEIFDKERPSGRGSMMNARKRFGNIKVSDGQWEREGGVRSASEGPNGSQGAKEVAGYQRHRARKKRASELPRCLPGGLC